MSGIASVGQLVAVIQARFSERAQAPAAANARRGARGAARPTGDSVELRVAGIDPADPQRGRKAFRVFLESVLLQELGSDLHLDPGFHQMVDDVQRMLEQDPRCAPLVRDAISHLLAARAADTTTRKT